MWGNSQPIEATIQDSNSTNRGASPGQLVRINYRRPESWHWMFAAKLMQGPNADPAALLGIQVEVAFDLIVGVGRSQISVDAGGSAAGSVFQGGKTFERFFFTWGDGPSKLFPVAANLYSTEVLAPNRTFRTNPPFPNQDGFPTPGDFVTGPSKISQIVAQDIQVNCRVIALSGPPGTPNIGQTVTVEVSAMFAPIVHVRPEWFKGGSFPGAEDGGGEQGSVAKQLEHLDKPKPDAGGEPAEYLDDYGEALEQYDDAQIERNRRAVEALDRRPAFDPDGRDYVERGRVVRRGPRRSG